MMEESENENEKVFFNEKEIERIVSKQTLDQFENLFVAREIADRERKDLEVKNKINIMDFAPKIEEKAKKVKRKARRFNDMDSCYTGAQSEFEMDDR